MKKYKKAYDRVPREKVWYCMRKLGVAEKYVRIVQDVYEDSTAAVRCARGKTEVVWTCTEERCWVHWEKDADDGAARKEETGKAQKEVYGCGKRGNDSSGSDGGRRR